MFMYRCITCMHIYIYVYIYIHIYIYITDATVARLRGMFAFVIVPPTRNYLKLVNQL
jgi:hypothetical protein